MSQQMKKYPDLAFWRYIDLGFKLNSLLWLNTEKAQKMLKALWLKHQNQKKLNFNVENETDYVLTETPSTTSPPVGAILNRKKSLFELLKRYESI